MTRRTGSEDRIDPVRRTVLFSGQVQGVGFRYSTQKVALRLAVTGFVRNLPDGRVELVAEGSPAELDRLQEAVEQTMSGYIRAASASDSPVTGEFQSFRICF